MKKVTILNCYDPALENIILKNKNDHDINLLYMSFLMYSKGIFHAMDAFGALATGYPNINLNIAGEIHSDSIMSTKETETLFLKKLKELKEKFGDRIKYYGVVKNNKKRELFEKCDVLLFPTFFLSESFGLVNIEAMRAGMAIVSTNHNFISNIISEEEGILVEPDSLKGLITGIRSLLDDKIKMQNIQKHNINLAKKLYSPDIFVEKMLDLLQSN